jgi:hypothetical protein
MDLASQKGVISVSVGVRRVTPHLAARGSSISYMRDLRDSKPKLREVSLIRRFGNHELSLRRRDLPAAAILEWTPERSVKVVHFMITENDLTHFTIGRKDPHSPMYIYMDGSESTHLNLPPGVDKVIGSKSLDSKVFWRKFDPRFPDTLFNVKVLYKGHQIFVLIECANDAYDTTIYYGLDKESVISEAQASETVRKNILLLGGSMRFLDKLNIRIQISTEGEILGFGDVDVKEKDYFEVKILREAGLLKLANEIREPNADPSLQIRRILEKTINEFNLTQH